ncbi:MAG: DUF4097 family beta strand repeat-containing protein [Pseudomonadota bacterium]
MQAHAVTIPEPLPPGLADALDEAVGAWRIVGVEVQGWDRPEVHVTGKLGAGVERLELTTQGTRTAVRVVLPKGRHWNADNEADLVVRMPGTAGLAASLVSADVTTRGVLGEQRLQTVSGEIRAELGREARLRSVSGDLNATRHSAVRGAGRVEAQTVSGNVELTGIDGTLEVSTVSGDSRLRFGQLVSGRFETVSGDFAVTATLAQDARLEAESVSGDLALRFPGAPPAAEYEIESFSGDVDNCFGPRPTQEQYGPGVRLVFREGAGSARVRADTKSGDVTLCNR